MLQAAFDLGVGVWLVLAGLAGILVFVVATTSGLVTFARYEKPGDETPPNRLPND